MGSGQCSCPNRNFGYDRRVKLSQATSLSYFGLTTADFDKIKGCAVRQEYKNGDPVFLEGASPDNMYFIETGRVSVFIQVFTQQKELSILGPGDCFGEFAFFNGDTRSASVVALEDVTLLSVDRTSFLALYESNPDIAGKIDDIRHKRNEKLIFEETLIDQGRADNEGFHVGIKGDPSLRESAFFRERYESVVDQYLPQLRSRLYDLLLNRSAYEVSLHFNSGELHFRTVFDPFNIEVHPAGKLVNKGYVERHFPLMNYEEKMRMVKRFYGFLGQDPALDLLPDSLSNGLRSNFDNWAPVSPAEIALVLFKLPLLRKIENFYIRNFTISTIRDAIRMQFNCDGTHFISANHFNAFINDNLTAEGSDASDPISIQRRKSQRREANFQDVSKVPKFGERRTPIGRRDEDWVLASSESSDTSASSLN